MCEVSQRHTRAGQSHVSSRVDRTMRGMAGGSAAIVEATMPLVTDRPPSELGRSTAQRLESIAPAPNRTLPATDSLPKKVVSDPPNFAVPSSDFRTSRSRSSASSRGEELSLLKARIAGILDAEPANGFNEGMAARVDKLANAKILALCAIMFPNSKAAELNKLLMQPDKRIALIERLAPSLERLLSSH